MFVSFPDHSQEEESSDAGNIPIDTGHGYPQHTAITSSADDIEMHEAPPIATHSVSGQPDSEPYDESDEASVESESGSEQYLSEKGSYGHSGQQVNEALRSSTENVDEYVSTQLSQNQSEPEPTELIGVEQNDTQVELKALDCTTDSAEHQQKIFDDLENSNSAPPSEPDAKPDDDVEMRDNEDGYEGNNDATLIVGEDVRTEEKNLDDEKKMLTADENVGNAVSTQSEQGDEKPAKLPSEDGSERKSGIDKDLDRKDNRKRKRSRSRSKSQTPPAKRAPRRSSPAQNIDDFTNDEDEPQFDENAVLLSWYDSDLHLKISPTDLCSARPISEAALGLAWAGARSTYGVTEGKVCYEIQVNEINRVQNLSDERNLYELRCGWSVLSDSLQLGEAELSFGYSGCAKKCLNSEFKDYGIKFGSRGDVIGVYLDLESSPCVIQYTVNGEPQGVAFEFNKDDLDCKALYPHVLSKNLAFTVNFGQCEKLLVNEERPNRVRREESSKKDSSSSRRDRESKRDGSSAEKEKIKSRDSGDKETVKVVETDESPAEEIAASNESADVGADLKTVDETEKADVTAHAIAAANGDNDDERAEAKGDESEDKKSDNNDDARQEQEEKNDEKKEDKKEEKKEEQKPKLLLPDYQLIGNLPVDQLKRGYVRPETRKECEVILLIGLPAAGKTHWAVNHSKQNVDKHYNLLGIQNLLDKMTVSTWIASIERILKLTQTNHMHLCLTSQVCGEPRKKHHKSGRWERFIDWTVRSLHLVQDIANKRRRNYILDQVSIVCTVPNRPCIHSV